MQDIEALDVMHTADREEQDLAGIEDDLEYLRLGELGLR